MKKRKHLKSTFYSWLLVLLCLCQVFAQNSKDETLSTARAFFHTKVYSNQTLLSRSGLNHRFAGQAFRASRNEIRKSNYCMIAAPLGVIGGGYLAIDALRGTSKSVTIEGEAYRYTVRPIRQLVVGLGLFATGVCLLEYANEFKTAAVTKYNNKVNAKGLSFHFSVSPSKGIGLMAKF
jgi:hypothetical protein